MVQPNGKERIDLWTAAEYADEVLETIKKKAAELSVRLAARLHRSYSERQAKKKKKHPTLKVVTWNVSALRGRRDAVREWIHKHRPDVITLTETLLRVDQAPFYVRGYRTFTQWADTDRSIVVLCANRLHARYASGMPHSKHVQWVRLESRKQTGLPTYIAGVYLSPTLLTEDRKQVIGQIMGAGRTGTGRTRGRVIAAGDWNCSATRLRQYLAEINSTVIDKIPGMDYTFYRIREGHEVQISDLDHVVVNAELHQPTPCWVDLDCTDSDHRPVQCTLDLGELPQQTQSEPGPRREIVDRKAIVDLPKDKAKKITGAQDWRDLGDAATDERTLADKASAVDTTTRRLLRQHKLLRKTRGQTCQQRPLLTQRQVRAMNWRRRAFRKVRDLISRRTIEPGHRIDAELTQAGQDWQASRREATAAKREASQKRSRKFQKWVTSRFLRPDGARRTWTWVREMLERGRRQQPRARVLRTDGLMARSETESAEARREYYARQAMDNEEIKSLATDANLEAWREKLRLWRELGQAMPGKPEREDWAFLRLPTVFNEADLLAQLHCTAYGKACGLEGLPAGVLKATIQKATTGSTPEQIPPMTRTVTTLLDSCLRLGRIPDTRTWTHSRCISIFKRGDSRQCANYRPIALIHPTLKLLLSHLARHIAAALEASGRLGPWQAGFRPRHSCAEQLLALQEVTARRRRSGQPTWVCFLDFTKAYDRVPHAAMLAKLMEIGVRGQIWNLIRDLYKKSYVVVEEGSARATPFRLERGLRQGCPLSPVLFNVFASDLFDECMNTGVTVPGLDYKVPGLTYADDTVLMSESRTGLVQSLRRVSDWCDQFGMALNAGKCAVLVTGPELVGPRPPPIPLRPTGQDPRGDIRYITADSKYRYLGVLIGPQAEMMLDRTQATSIMRIRVLRVCRNSPLSLCCRVLIAKPLLEGTAMSYAEFQHTARTTMSRTESQTVQAYKSILGLQRNVGIETTTLRNELGLRPANAIAMMRRVRLFLRGLGSNTLAGDLTRCPTSTRRQTRTRTQLEQTAHWLLNTYKLHTHPKDVRALACAYKMTRTHPQHLLYAGSKLKTPYEVATGRQETHGASRPGRPGPVQTRVQAKDELEAQWTAVLAGKPPPRGLFETLGLNPQPDEVWLITAHVISRRVSEYAAKVRYEEVMREVPALADRPPQQPAPDHRSIRGRYSFWGLDQTAPLMWKPGTTLHTPNWILKALPRLRLDQYPLMTTMRRWGWQLPQGAACPVCKEEDETLGHLLIDCKGHTRSPQHRHAIERLQRAGFEQEAVARVLLGGTATDTTDKKWNWRQAVEDCQTPTPWVPTICQAVSECLTRRQRALGALPLDQRPKRRNQRPAHPAQTAPAPRPPPGDTPDQPAPPPPDPTTPNTHQARTLPPPAPGTPSPPESPLPSEPPLPPPPH